MRRAEPWSPPGLAIDSLGVMAAAALASGLVLLKPLYLVPVAGALAVVFGPLLLLARPGILIAATLLVAALSPYLSMVRAVLLPGLRVSVLGTFWIAMAAGSVVLILFRAPRAGGIPMRYASFAALWLWMLVIWLASGADPVGTKDLLFYALPALVGTAASLGLPRRDSDSAVRVIDLFIVAAGLLLLLYWLFELGFWLGLPVPRSPIIPREARPAAQFLAIALAPIAVAAIDLKPGPRRRAAALVSLLIVATIFYTAARVVSVTALLVVCLAWMRKMTVSRLMVGGTLVAVAAILLVLTVPVFRQRTFLEPVPELPTSGLENLTSVVNTSGRNVMWPLAWNHAMERPLAGWGPGSARRYLAVEIGIYENEHSPHNEFLQAFHDGGAIGALLLAATWGGLGLAHRRDWQRALGRGDARATFWNKAATLAIFAALLMATTSNVLHYGYVVAPVAVISACAYQQRPGPGGRG